MDEMRISPGDMVSLTVCHMCFSADRPRPGFSDKEDER